MGDLPLEMQGKEVAGTCSFEENRRAPSNEFLCRVQSPSAGGAVWGCAHLAAPHLLGALLPLWGHGLQIFLSLVRNQTTAKPGQ